MHKSSVRIKFLLAACSLIAACGAGTGSETQTIPSVATFNVTLVSVDVRRNHDGERIEVTVGQIDSGPLQVSLSD